MLVDLNPGVMKRIEEKLHTLATMEDMEYDYMPELTRQLRHAVMYVHQKIERAVDLAIADHMREAIHTELDLMDMARFNSRMESIFNEMDIAKKLKIADGLGLLPKGFLSKSMQINQMRVWFSHPKSHRAKMNEYKSATNVDEALNLLVGMMDVINKMASDWMQEIAKKKRKEFLEKE